MARKAYILACTSDLSGRVRGKGFPLEDIDKRWQQGVGWTPTNSMINCFGNIPATPWGAAGDLTLRPDPAGRVDIDFEDGGPVERFVLGDIEQLDGTPWPVCPRNYLRSALDELSARQGLCLRVAFEHEFTCLGLAPRLGAAYGIEAIRAVGNLPETIMGLLESNGLEPDTFLPEYSPGQLELTVRPALGLEAADRAVKLRQIVRAACLRAGMQASFSPIMKKGGVGNGMHIHFSLEDMAGAPLSHDASRPGGMSAVAGQFVAGILAHGRALCAVTAPSVISYERLRPNAWSASVTNLGQRDREAMVRICPVSERPGADVSKSYNFEFRATDAAATPYLALGALVRAGLDGLARQLVAPVPTSVEEADGLSPEQRRERGIHALPQSLGEALDELAADATLMPDELKAPYLMHKRGEIADAAALDVDALCARYAEVY